jgi:2'-5' RNA ligase
MKRKLFLGIDLDPYLKKMLGQATKEWQSLPIKWHQIDHLHLQLVSLGWVEEDLIIELSEQLKQSCAEWNNFEIKFEKIELAYPKKNISSNSVETKNQKRKANRVLLIGEVSEELKQLQKNLEIELDMYFTERKNFRPQVVLGQMRVKQWQKLEQRPEIQKDFSITMDVLSVALFESGGVDKTQAYQPIDIFNLKDLC